MSEKVNSSGATVEPPQVTPSTPSTSETATASVGEASSGFIHKVIRVVKTGTAKVQPLLAKLWMLLPFKVRNVLEAAFAKVWKIAVATFVYARRFLYGRVPTPPAELRTVSDPDPVTNLPSLVVAANWKMPPSRLPHWLVRARGPQLEEILPRLLDRMRNEQVTGASACWAGEARNAPGVSRPLRIVHNFAPGHISTTDVSLRAEGTDLYVRFGTQPRTLLTYLRYAFYTSVFLAAFLTIFGLYLFATGAYSGWVADYAQKYAKAEHFDEDKSSFYTRKIKEGYYETDWEEFHRRLREDPTLVERIKAYLASPENPVRKNLPEFMRGMTGMSLNIGGDDTDMLGQQFGFGSKEYAFDILLEKAILNLNPDEFALAYTRDKRITVMGMAVAPGLYSTQFVETVSLRDVLEHLCQNDSKISEKVLYAFDKSTTWHSSWSPIGLFFADPKVALFSLGMPCGIIAALVGAVVWRMPQTLMRFPCRWLNWPTPHDFNDNAVNRNGWVERVLTQTLEEDFGVARADIIDLGTPQ